MEEELLEELETESEVGSDDLSSDPTQPILTEEEKYNILSALLDKLEEEEETETETIEEITTVIDEDITSDSEYLKLIYEYMTQEETETETYEELEDIMNKPIKDYTVQESLLLFVGVCLFVGGIVWVIKKGLPLWK